ncbi:hypothetical protein [Anoxybacteroides tepidamans]|uniref:SunI/YnzG family protein n=1 Tax=Anoxybacteroides tepidamans TaxID=265948 RepID=UPI000487C758|nr:hypothetical protein [Anoxybacillus tepidamans]
MLGIQVKKSNDNLVIRWLLSKIEIPISEVATVTLDDTYGGEEKEAIRIGAPYGTCDRVVIRTNRSTYILFTDHARSIRDKICSLINK